MVLLIKSNLEKSLEASSFQLHRELLRLLAILWTFLLVEDRPIVWSSNVDAAAELGVFCLSLG